MQISGEISYKKEMGCVKNMSGIHLNPFYEVDEEQFDAGIRFLNERLCGLNLKETKLPSELMQQMIDRFGGKVTQFYGMTAYPWSAEAIVGLKTGKEVFEDFWIKFGFRPKVEDGLRLTGKVQFYLYILNSQGMAL
ncbi:MAG: hypothetical protein ABF868_03225 [Sporolactobacillus sp.]